MGLEEWQRRNLTTQKGSNRIRPFLKNGASYIYCNYSVTFICSPLSDIKPRLLVALVSFESPLATGRLPIFSPEFFFFHWSFFCVLGMHASSLWSVMQHFLTVKVRGRYYLYNKPSLRILLFSKLNWIECSDWVNLGSVIEHDNY